MKRSESCLSDRTLDALLAGETIVAANVAHLDACADCKARRATLAAERAQFLVEVRPKAFAEAVLARAPKRRRMAWWFALGPALAAAAVLVVWTTRPAQEERTKGGPVAVELYLRRGEKMERFLSEKPVQRGDTLQLLYTVQAPLHLTVLDVEAGGRAQVLYKNALAPATRRALDRSWVLDEGNNAERLYLVFTERAVDEATLLAAARRVDPKSAEKLDVAAAAQVSFLLQRAR